MTLAIAALLALTQDKGGELSAELRGVMLTGDAIDDERWSDFFDHGVGLGVRYTHLFRDADDYATGLYAKLTFDHFSGGGISEPGFDLDTDALDMIRLMVGVEAR